MVWLPNNSTIGARGLLALRGAHILLLSGLSVLITGTTNRGSWGTIFQGSICSVALSAPTLPGMEESTVASIAFLLFPGTWNNLAPFDDQIYLTSFSMR